MLKKKLERLKARRQYARLSREQEGARVLQEERQKLGYAGAQQLAAMIGPFLYLDSAKSRTRSGLSSDSNGSMNLKIGKFVTRSLQVHN